MSINPTKMIIGVRHEKLYVFTDHVGEIVDKLREVQNYSNWPNFSFDAVSVDAKIGTVKVKNSEGTFDINCSSDGYLVSASLGAEYTKGDLESTANILADSVLPIISAQNVIDRFGVVFHYTHTLKAGSSESLQKVLTGVDLDGDLESCLVRQVIREEKCDSPDSNDSEEQIRKIMRTELIVPQESDGIPNVEQLINVEIDIQKYFYPSRPYDRNSLHEFISYAEKNSTEILETNFHSEFSDS